MGVDADSFVSKVVERVTDDGAYDRDYGLAGDRGSEDDSRIRPHPLSRGNPAGPHAGTAGPVHAGGAPGRARRPPGGPQTPQQSTSPPHPDTPRASPARRS